MPVQQRVIDDYGNEVEVSPEKKKAMPPALRAKLAGGKLVVRKKKIKASKLAEMEAARKAEERRIEMEKQRAIELERQKELAIAKIKQRKAAGFLDEVTLPQDLPTILRHGPIIDSSELMRPDSATGMAVVEEARLGAGATFGE